MRIVCEKCATKYSVDDRLITTRGVRAQCPRCRHAQLIRRLDAEGASPQPPATAARASSPGPAIPSVAPLPSATSSPRANPNPNLDPNPTPITPSPAPLDPVPTAHTPFDPFADDSSLADGTSNGVPAAEDPFETAAEARPRVPWRPPRRLLWLWIGGAAALVAAAIAAWIALRPGSQTAARPTGASSAGDRTDDARPDDGADPARDVVAEGERLLRERGAEGAPAAQEMFEKAVKLDPSNARAVAGFGRAVELSASGLDEPRFEQALAVLAAAERRSKDRIGVALARAEVLLAKPTPAREGEARELAEKVLEQAQDPLRRARAHRVMGRSWLKSSSALAAKSLGEALALDPRLAEAWSERAAALEASGDYAGALEHLQKRLEVEPGHWPSVEGRARIFGDVGRPARARAEYARILREQPRHLRARIGMAAVQYRAEGRPRDAARALTGIAAALPPKDRAGRAEVFVHLAAAERAAGNASKAERAARNALAAAPEDPAANLQLLFVAIDRRRAAEADARLPAIAGKLGDPSVEKLLEGRVRMLQARWDDAEKALRAAHDLDRRRVDAVLLAGVSAARARRRDDALHHLMEAVRADPARAPPPLAGPRLFLDPKWLLAGHGDVLSSLSKGRDDASGPIFDAVLRYRAGDSKAAAKRLRAAALIDRDNGLALAWRAYLAFRSGDRRSARSLGAQAVSQERLLGLGHYVLGAALAEGGDTAQARKALTEAVRLDPGLFGAEYELAALDARQGDVGAARQRLVRAVTLDPSFLMGKELLFALETEAPREGARPR